MTKGTIGVVDGMKTYAVFGEDGKVAPVYSISAGLDYPGVGPEHAFFKDSGRVEYVAATDDEAVKLFFSSVRQKGSSQLLKAHAIAEAVSVLHNWIKTRSSSSMFPDVGIRMWLPSPII